MIAPDVDNRAIAEDDDNDDDSDGRGGSADDIAVEEGMMLSSLEAFWVDEEVMEGIGAGVAVFLITRKPLLLLQNEAAFIQTVTPGRKDLKVLMHRRVHRMANLESVPKPRIYGIL